jgi:adenine-specific DNA-methyltransferase
MVSGCDKAFRVPDLELDSLTQNEIAATMKVVKAKDADLLIPKSHSRYINVPIGLSEKDFRHDYPNFARIMKPYREILEARYSYGRVLPYWEWSFRRSEKMLTSNTTKGFIPCKERMTNKAEARFSIVKPGMVATQDMTAFIPLEGVKESIEYIVAFLTLPAVSDWIRLRGLMKGGVAEFSERPLGLTPFLPIDFSDSRQTELHDRITATAKAAQDTGNSVEALKELRAMFAQLMTKEHTTAQFTAALAA